MMSASSPPTAQPTMPAGFSAFLTNIGQISESGIDGGFDRLLAAAPAQAAAMPVTQAPEPQAVVPPAEGLPVETDTAAKVPAVKADPAKTDATAQAENLLIALNGGAQGATPAPAKTAASAAETEAPSNPEATDGAEPPPGNAANWAAIVAAIVPANIKAATPVDARAKPADGRGNVADVPQESLLAATPRGAVSTLPLAATAMTTTGAPAATPADAAPSMTILFAQPATQHAAPVAEVSAPTQIAERVLDMDSDGAWIDQLARDIAATRSDSGDISFRLMPRHLGRLDVAMQMGDDGVALKMDTQHEATATIVNAAQGRLVEELRQQGVRVAGAEVTCTPGETGRQSQNQGQGRTAAPDAAHLIETATERAEPRDEGRAAERRGRFA
ncbi:flagellar hook-length control protein FliK [Sphingopyxis sp. JAI128]|uniref:flagellar hook-length control protein FliK n=1 Tax=Sphingopyxis sp. JAI128 TaxID=2723066 RepID=UPI001618F2CF|nr:flagellar hook-length control protein FliK [Sphingopyxis sp. JAI128]MBB6426478.1 flagellar hook-length control protein FliK [Sphingopyxis sp. JAI128]